MIRDAEWWDVKFFHKNEILPADAWFIEDYEGVILKKVEEISYGVVLHPYVLMIWEDESYWN